MATRIDTRWSGLAGLAWPTLMVVVAAVISVLMACSGADCVVKDAATQVPVGIAAPVVAALYGAGWESLPIVAVGGAVSAALWIGLGVLLARIVGPTGWRRWWTRYLGVALLWTISLVAGMAWLVRAELF